MINTSPIQSYLARPNAEFGPTEVMVGIYIKDIFKVDEIDQTFEVDFWLELRWQDERLISCPEKTKTNTFRNNIEGIWHPLIVVLNQRQLTKNLEGVIITPDKTVIYEQRYQGLISSTLDLQDFPFDKQELEIKISSFAYGPKEVKLIKNQRLTGLSQLLSLPNYSVNLGSTNIITLHNQQLKRDFMVFDYRLELKRYSSYYKSKVIFPLVLIILMSYGVFWLSPQQVVPQITIAVTSILTLMAYLFSVEQRLPQVPYLTAMDKFLIGSMLLVFLAFVESLVTIDLAEIGKEVGAITLEKGMRWIFPSLIVSLLVLVFRPCRKA